MECKRTMAIVLFLILATAAMAQQPVVTWSASMSMSSFSPGSGDLITFTTVIRAAGGTARNVTVIGGVDDQELFLKTIPLLAPSETQKVEFTWTATAGTHKAYFYIDPDRAGGNYRVEQTRQERTVYVSGGAPVGTAKTTVKATPDIAKKKSLKPVRPVKIDPQRVRDAQDDQQEFVPLMQEAEHHTPEPPECETPALPDLVITDVAVWEETQWYPGGNTQIKVTVQNIGQCDTGPVLVELKVREQTEDIDRTLEIGSLTIAPIPSHYGNAYTMQDAFFNYTVTNYSGITAFYTFTATVDPNDFHPEFLDNNNETSISYRIDPY